MLNRWDPFSELSRVQDEMSRWLEPQGRRQASFAPAVDIFEEKDAILVKAELPGVKPDDVHINVERNLLTLRGERKLEKEDNKEGYHRIERAYGMFTRSFSLPDTVDTENIDASYDAGVLTVRLPKKASVQPKRIAVKAGAGTEGTGMKAKA